MAKRLRRRAPHDPVVFSFDGVPIEGASGESLAEALWAAGEKLLSRSPKFHRPRGAFCLRGDCEGCLVRVQGAPNVRACQVVLRAGTELQVERQNFLGTASFDLLQVADWVFRDGFDHHHFLAGVPVLDPLLRSGAREIAGLGELPTAPARPSAQAPARRQACEALVVGAGRAGRAAVAQLQTHGVRPRWFDARAEPGEGAERGTVIAGFRQADGGLELLCERDGSIELLAPRALVLAVGAYDAPAPFENNDRPGILSLRAAQQLLARGLLLGESPCLVRTPGAVGEGAAWAEAHGVPALEGEVVAAHGAQAIDAVTVRTRESLVTQRTDALILDAPLAPAYELGASVGGELAPCAQGFRLVEDGAGQIAAGVWAIGAVVGAAAVRSTVCHDAAAQRLAESIAAWLAKQDRPPT